MNLFSALRRRAIEPSDFGVPNGWDALLSMYGSARPINGEFEWSDANLDVLSERVLKRSGPVWSLIALRMLAFSEARFQWQQLRNGRAGELFGDQSLGLLETPWAGGTTADLLSRMIQDVDLVGNSFVTNRNPGRLKRLRPDWVTMIYGSNEDPGYAGDAIDGELIAYVYTPRQTGASMGEGVILTPDEVAHFAPYPDPQGYHRGMSWLTPVLREVEADDAALVHKGAFFRNGASPKLAMKVDPSISKPNFEKLVAAMEQAHNGPWNAYKTLYIGGGADPVPMTFSLKDLDYGVVQAAGERRLAAAAGVPSVIVGMSDGGTGSGAVIGQQTYEPAMKRFIDLTLRPLWRSAAGSLEAIFPPPASSRLWYDTRDVAFLREDEKDAAEVRSQNATVIRTLVDAGFEPDVAVQVGASGDFSLLVGAHTGLFSVQLQPPGNGELGDDGKADAPPPPEPPAPPAASESTAPEPATDTSGQKGTQ